MTNRKNMRKFLIGSSIAVIGILIVLLFLRNLNSHADTAEQLPPAPTNLILKTSDDQVTLTWTPTAVAPGKHHLGYRIARSTSRNGHYTVLTTRYTQTSYIDKEVKDGTTYWYRVRTVQQAQEGPNHNSPIHSRPAGPLSVTVTRNGTVAKVKLEAVSYGDKPFGGREPITDTDINLAGARNETLNFLVKAKLNECQDLTLEPFTITTAGGIDSPATVSHNLKLYSMPFIQLSQPSYKNAPGGNSYDPLIPIEQKDGGFTLCPGEKNGGGFTWFWGEFSIKPGTQPGNYNSALAITNQVRLPINLQVYKLTLPDKFGLPLYAGFQEGNMLIGHYGNENKTNDALVDRYVQAMLEHHLIPFQLTNHFARQLEIVKRNGQPELNIEDGFKAHNIDPLPSWAPIAFPDRFHNTQLSTLYSEGKTDTIKDYLIALNNTVKRYNLADRAAIYMWDEPKDTSSHSDVANVKGLAKMVKTYAPTVKTLVSASSSFIPHQSDVGPLVSYFVPEVTYLGSHQSEILYTACSTHDCAGSNDYKTPDFIIDRPSSYVVTLGALTTKVKANAFHYYQAVFGYNDPKGGPWKNPYYEGGNGEGTLFYPGRKNEPDIIPSIRLKNYRDASNLRQYTRLLESKGSLPDWYRSDLETLVKAPNDFDKNYKHYDDFRRKIGIYLETH